MLKIEIAFADSWSNRFLNENFEPLFKSSTGFQASHKTLQAVPLLCDSRGSLSLVESVRQLNRKNPSMAYRVPENYDNTVLGIIARLLGEVRRVTDLEPNHPARWLYERTHYRVDISSERFETMTLATPANQLQGSGAGVVDVSQNEFYLGGPLARHLFGHLELPFEVLLSQGLDAQGAWTPRYPNELLQKLTAYAVQQKQYFKALKLEKGEAAVEAVQESFATQIKERLAAAGVNAGLDSSASWNFAGALLAAKVHLLDEAKKSTLKAQGCLSGLGNFPGLAMSGKTFGNMTLRDFYVGIGGRKAYSTRMAYSVPLPFFQTPEQENKNEPVSVTVGIIKKSGVLHISINIDEEVANAVTSVIQAAAVFVFHFGKKGIAYVDRIYYQHD